MKNVAWTIVTLTPILLTPGSPARGADSSLVAGQGTFEYQIKQHSSGHDSGDGSGHYSGQELKQKSEHGSEHSSEHSSEHDSEHNSEHDSEHGSEHNMGNSGQGDSGDSHHSGSEHGGHAHGGLEIPSDRPRPTIEIQVFPDAVQGWNLEVQVTHFRFAPERINQASNFEEGHAHLYIDGEKVTRLYSNWYYLGNLPPGEHQIKVSLNANGHETLMFQGEEIADAVILTVLSGN